MSKENVQNQSYEKIAFCSAISPSLPEHYENLKKEGIKTVSICLHLSGFKHYRFATLHTEAAKMTGMAIHAYMLTDLVDVKEDVIRFTKRFMKLGYTTDSKITIWMNSAPHVPDKEEKINQLVELMSRYFPRENLDLAFFKAELDMNFYNLTKIRNLHSFNFTIVNSKASEPGHTAAGTWVYTTDFQDVTQALAYDFYSFYTKDSFQLNLDGRYTTQTGDSWYTISKRTGVPLHELLNLNPSIADKRLFEGQIIKVA